MTITSEQSKVVYQGNGSITEFPVPFRYVRDADLEVLLRGPDGSERILAAGTDYALSAAPESGGGTCVLALAPVAGEVLAIRRDPPLLQETVYEEGVPLSAKARENALDLLTMIAQSNRERIERALLLPVSREGATPVVPEPSAGAVLAWDGSGNLANGPDTSAISAASQAATEALDAAGDSVAARDAALAAQAAVETALASARSLADAEHNGLIARDAEDCHPVGAVTGLRDELDGKAALAHTHTAQEITGAMAGATDQERRQIYLNAARLAAVSGEMADGYLWAFAEDELTTSTNATYDAAGGAYFSSGNPTPMAGGVPFTNADYSQTDPANCFDGSTATGCAKGYTPTALMVGKGWGERKSITGVVVKGLDAQGYAQGGDTVSIHLYGSDSAPASPTDGTLIDTLFGPISDSNTVNPQSKLSGIPGNSFAYHWVAVVAGNENATWLSEVQFYELSDAADMTLSDDALEADAPPDGATLYVLHQADAGIDPGLDFAARVSRDGGASWADAASDFAAICALGDGWTLYEAEFDLSALESGTAMQWEVATFNNKPQRIGMVMLTWR